MADFLDKYEVTPIGNNVILRRASSEEVSAGGIVLPSSAQEKSLKATVIAVGPGMVVGGGQFVETTVKVGDTVLIDKIGGFELELDDEKVLVMREPEIIAVIKRK